MCEALSRTAVREKIRCQSVMLWDNQLRSREVLVDCSCNDAIRLHTFVMSRGTYKVRAPWYFGDMRLQNSVDVQGIVQGVQGVLKGCAAI